MSNRLTQLGRSIADAGADAFILQEAISMGYVAGFGENGHERFLALFVDKHGHATLVCPALSEQQARRSGLTDIRSWKDGEDAQRLVAQLVEEKGWAHATLLVDDYMKSMHLLQLQSTVPGAKFHRGGPVLEELMRAKDSSEIEALRYAGDLADQAWTEVKPTIKPGDTEREVAERLAAAMKIRGGRPTFGIVAAGPMGAEPHHESDETVLREGDVVICDFGCEWGGYQSDITRTIALGTPSEKAVEAYDIVLRAHQAGRDAVRVGATRDSVDRAARAVIEASGRGEFFTHRLGHGIGRKGHEEPYLTPGDQRPLKLGDCFSIEPGVYHPGEFGIRIENIYALTEEGCTSMNAEPESRLG